MHRWVSLFAPIALAILLLAPDATVGQDAGSPLVDVSVDGSPLLLGSGGDIEVMVTLAAAADLRLRIADFDGRTIQELYTGSREAGTLMRSSARASARASRAAWAASRRSPRVAAPARRSRRSALRSA